MANQYILPPPSSAPGPYRPTVGAPIGRIGSSAPNIVRWHVVQPGESLWKIAQQYYHSPGEWVRIFNANRDGVGRPDGTPGTLINSDVVTGERLIIP